MKTPFLKFNNFFILFFISILFLKFNACYKSKDDSFSATALVLLQTKNIQVNIMGDSLSQKSSGFSLSQKLGSGYTVKDFSVSGRTQADWILDVSNALNPNPDIMLIELGTNDAMNLPNAQFSDNLNELITEIQNRSTAKIILTAIPLTNDPILQEKIRQNNTIVRTLGNKFIIADIEKEFDKNKNNYSLYPLNDKIHPEPIGYEIMGETFKLAILLK